MSIKKESMLAILYTTVNTQADAEALATLVLHQKLAASINIIPLGNSFYLWEGQVRNNAECSLLFKTLPTHAEQLKNLVIHHHPCEIPTLLQWNAETSTPFFKYLDMEITKEFL